MSNTSRKASKLAIRRAEAWKLYTSGMSQTEVAQKLNTSQKTISRDILLMLEEFRKDRIDDVEKFRASEISSLNQLELDAHNNIKVIQKYLDDRAAGLDVKCTVVPIDLVKWNELIVKLKTQKSRISGLDKASVVLDATEPVKVILKGFAEIKNGA